MNTEEEQKNNEIGKLADELNQTGLDFEQVVESVPSRVLTFRNTEPEVDFNKFTSRSPNKLQPSYE